MAIFDFLFGDRNPPPVETQIQLDFQELELITREKVLEENEPMSFGPTNSTN